MRALAAQYAPIVRPSLIALKYGTWPRRSSEIAGAGTISTSA